jgi:hypothetical protein
MNAIVIWLVKKLPIFLWNLQDFNHGLKTLPQECIELSVYNILQI